MDNKNVIYKIIELENHINKSSFRSKNKKELYKLLTERINKYLDDPKCIYTKNYLNLYSHTNVDLRDFYKVMFENLNNKTKNFDLVIILNIGSFANLNYIKTKLDIFEQLFLTNKILLIITIIEEIYFEVIKLDYFMDFEKNLILLKVKNKGCDIGPFYLALDYIYKNQIDYTNILKLHTKSDLNWLTKLTPYLENKSVFLNILDYIKLNNINIYGNNRIYLDYRNLLSLKYILDNYQEGLLEELICNNKLTFIAGTVFIINKKLIDFVLKLVPLENYLFFEEVYSSNYSIYEQSIIHTIERLFCIADIILRNEEKLLEMNCNI
jgi:hypothetical protein